MKKKKNRRPINQAGIYAVGNIIRQLAGFIMLPIYTQHLTPADYGVVGLLMFAIGLIDIAFGARLAQAAPKFYYELNTQKERNSVISTALIQTSGISILTVLTLLLFREQSSIVLFGIPDYTLIISLFSITILTQAIENYGLLFIRMQEKPILFISINLIKLIIQLSMNIWLIVFMELGVLGVAITSASTSLLFALLLGAYTLSKTGSHYNKALGWKMILFSWPLWLAGLAGIYIGSSNRYYMRIFGSLDDIGLYELGGKFAAITTLLIWQPFNMFWQTERFKLYKAGQPASTSYQSTFFMISTILCVAGLGISIFADTLIKIMSNPEYHAAASVVPYLTLAAIFNCLITFFNFSLLATNNTIKISKNNYLTVIISSVLFLILIPEFGYLGAAAALCLAYGLQMLNMHRISRHHFDLKIKLSPLALMILCSAVGYTLSNYYFMQPNLWLDITVKVGIFIIFATLMLGTLLINPNNRELASKFLEKLRSKSKGKL
jgi:O-antigen/teichoic acid export membrane protein